MTTSNKTRAAVNIVGIGGLPRSGKDTLAELFMKNGYYGVSLGDIVRNESKIRHSSATDPISVANMTDTSNWLRQTKGPDFALKEALDLYEKAQKRKAYKGLVVFSVRAPVEADFILEHVGELIWVEAADEIRWQRWLQNLREGETQISLEEFKKQEALQWKPQKDKPTNVQMNVSYIKDRATKEVVNNGNNLEEFISKAKKFINETQGKPGAY